MFGKSSFILICAVFAMASCRVVREAPKTPDSFTEFFEAAGKNLKELEGAVLKAFGVDDTKQLEEKVVAKGKEFATQMDEWAETIKKQTEDLKESPAVKELRTSVDTAITNFKTQHPETTDAFKNYIDTITKESEKIVGKLKTLGESDEAKNIKELSTKLLDTTATTFQSITTQVQEGFKKN